MYFKATILNRAAGTYKYTIAKHMVRFLFFFFLFIWIGELWIDMAKWKKNKKNILYTAHIHFTHICRMDSYYRKRFWFNCVANPFVAYHNHALDISIEIRYVCVCERVYKFQCVWTLICVLPIGCLCMYYTFAIHMDAICPTLVSTIKWKHLRKLYRRKIEKRAIWVRHSLKLWLFVFGFGVCVCVWAFARPFILEWRQMKSLLFFSFIRCALNGCQWRHTDIPSLSLLSQLHLRYAFHSVSEHRRAFHLCDDIDFYASNQMDAHCLFATADSFSLSFSLFVFISITLFISASRFLCAVLHLYISWYYISWFLFEFHKYDVFKAPAIYHMGFICVSIFACESKVQLEQIHHIFCNKKKEDRLCFCVYIVVFRFFGMVFRYVICALLYEWQKGIFNF